MIEEVIYFEPCGDTDSAVKFKDFVVQHGYEIDRETASLTLCQLGKILDIHILDFTAEKSGSINLETGIKIPNILGVEDV